MNVPCMDSHKYLYTFPKLVTFVSLPHSPGGGLEEAATLTPLTRLSMATFSLCSMSRTRLRRGCKCSFAYLGEEEEKKKRGGWRKDERRKRRKGEEGKVEEG